ncbi:MAG TPA: hypothetical protein VIN75_12545 [Burkholderiaceae bacterium]
MAFALDRMAFVVIKASWPPRSLAARPRRAGGLEGAAMTAPPSSFRKARNRFPLAAIAHGLAVTLPTGEWFVEERGNVVMAFSDPLGETHVADVALVDFLDGLARREIVFMSWG